MLLVIKFHDSAFLEHMRQMSIQLTLLFRNLVLDSTLLNFVVSHFQKFFDFFLRLLVSLTLILAFLNLIELASLFCVSCLRWSSRACARRISSSYFCLLSYSVLLRYRKSLNQFSVYVPLFNVHFNFIELSFCSPPDFFSCFQ